MSEARPTEAVMRLLNHLEHLMDIGVLTEDSIPVDMWNDVSCCRDPLLFEETQG